MRPILRRWILAALLLSTRYAAAEDAAPVVLQVSDKPLNAIRLFADANRFVAGGDDALIHVWDIAAGAETIAIKGHRGAVNGLAIARTERRIASAGGDNTFRVWDLSNGRPVFALTASHPLMDVTYAPTTNHAVVGGLGGTALLCDLVKRAFVPDWPPEPAGAGGAAWSPDGNVIAAAGLGSGIQLYDGVSFAKLKLLEGPNRQASVVTFSRDSKAVVSGYGDGSLVVWAIEAGQTTAQFTEHKAAVKSADFAPDGGTVASAAGEKFALLWDVKTGKTVRTFDSPAGVNAVTFSPNGQFVAAACADGAVRLYPLGDAKIATRTFDLDGIERPAYRSKPKPIVKNLTSITSMVVQTSGDGAVGVTNEVIATVSPASRSGSDPGQASFARDVGGQMKTSFDEAVRAVRLRYPVWEAGRIDVSFDDKYVPIDGGSAGTAFALLTLSALEGFDIDPKFAVTGDITVDWKVRPIGGVSLKLRGAAAARRLYAAIPDANEIPFADMGLLYGHSAYWDLQVFSIGTLQQALAVARTDRPAPLAEAIKLFADLQPELAKAERATLQKAETKATLKHILELAPNHLSAKYALALAEGTAPKTLSAAATDYQLMLAIAPYLEIVRKGEKYSRANVTSALTAATRKRIDALRPIANKDLMPMLVDLSAFTETLDGFLANRLQYPALQAKADALIARSKALSDDPNYMEKRMREGY